MVRHIVLAGFVALLASQVAQQQSAAPVSSLPDAPRQQAAPAQGIPDGPSPQPQLPGAGSITPGKGTTAPGAAVPSGLDSVQTYVPGTSLPAAPRANGPEVTHPDDGAAPEIVAGDPAKTFTLRGAGINFVEVPFTVKDSKNKLVPGIGWRDVRVYENGYRQQLQLFTVDPFPLSVALVIDQSVTFDTMTKVNSALPAAVGAFAPYDEVAVFTYNNGPKQETDFTAAQSPRLGVILERSKGKGREPLMSLDGPLSKTTFINNHDVDPNTSANRSHPGISNPPKEVHTLNDAILAAAVALTKAAPGRRRIIYVISDGKEYGSTAKYKDVIQYLQHNKIAVYATLVGDPTIPGLGFMDSIHLPFTMRDNALPLYTKATGGQIDPEFFRKGIEQSFARITEEVRTQYTVGYNSREPFIDGKYRNIEVKVLRPNLQVIAKKGYFPTAFEVRPNTSPAPR